MPTRTVRKLIEFSDGRRFVPGDRIVVGEDPALERLERWLADTGAITSGRGRNRVHDFCIILAPFQMLHSERCVHPEAWQ